jgi:triosephosphate isomerase (TIM)
MSKKYIVANWKSNKTLAEAQEWLMLMEALTHYDDKEVIVCPPFTALSGIKKYRDEKAIPFYLGTQNISPFAPGAYTGEVAAIHAKELADYVIIGHSERREHFGENDDILGIKVGLAKAVGFSVIYCVQGKDTVIPEGVHIVAYEPVFAIGSGTPDTPENAEDVSRHIKEQKGAVVLYGGSVKPENIRSFTEKPSIDGALVGGASLEAESFLALIHNA